MLTGGDGLQVIDKNDLLRIHANTCMFYALQIRYKQINNVIFALQNTISVTRVFHSDLLSKDEENNILLFSAYEILVLLELPLDQLNMQAQPKYIF